MRITMDNHNVTRESVLALIDKKDKIEQELSNLKVVLDTNSTDMREPVVDDAGFPRNDIDVYQVRHARQRIICLTNDHTAIMKEIENGLHALHAKESGGPEFMEVSTTDAASTATSSPLLLEPIVRVNIVSPHSPAELAGLKVDDKILEFGSVNANNFKSLQDIGNVVKYSQGQNVNITVKREGKPVKLHLIPQTWSGQGLLGCGIVPLDAVDR